MTETDKLFSGSIPELYDTYLVPLIFEQYANDIAKRVVDFAPKTILETAAGSGVVTRTLAPLLAADAHYTVTDLNQPMLDYAKEKQQPDNRILWRQSDALNLPFNDAEFDAVLCQFGIMFFPDRVAGYSEAKRVLKPGGKFIFSVWDHIEDNEFAHVVTEAVASIFPDDPPNFLPRTPHGYYDVELIEDELRKAGFSQVSISTIDKISSAPTPRHPAVAYCEGTPLRNEIEARDASLLRHITEQAANSIAKRFGGGPVSGKIQAHIVTAGH